MKTPPEVQIGLGTIHALVKKGHYLEALRAIRLLAVPANDQQQRTVLTAELQLRTGDSDGAVRAASSILRQHATPSTLAARCHVLLGTACRDRGRLAEAIEHFHKAIVLTDRGPDRETRAWARLRLMLALAEESGPQAAGGLVAEVRRSIAQYGDPQAVAAFHLFLAEIETKRGLFDSVRRHLKTGRALLTHEPNSWLGGFADIAELCLAYLESDLTRAAAYGDAALKAAEVSGHRVTGMAAMTNLGHVLLSQGEFAEAEELLRKARSICPPGGGAEVAILDGLAQIKLATGDLGSCRRVLDEMESSAASLEPNSYYYLCTRLTRGRLLLRSGDARRARDLATDASRAAFKRSFVNLTAHLRLLRAEALVRTGQHQEAAGVIAEAVDAREGPPSMEMLAEIARVAGLALAARPGAESGAVAFERAACILGTVGNRSGRVDLLRAYAECLWPRVAGAAAPFEGEPRTGTLPPPARRVTARLDAVTLLVAPDAPPAAVAADRAATILDSGGYPEVLAHETVALLRETGAAPSGVLAAARPGDPPEIISWWGCSWTEAACLAARPPRAIDLGAWHGRTFTLSVPQPRDPGPLVALLATERLVASARWQERTRREERERAALWPVDQDGESGDAIFRSEAMNEIVASARKVAGISLTVLLTGETGTGKEVLARVIHAASPRAARPFVPFNCTAVPREMIDSQLFGYRRGAFTGAVADFPGVIRAAQGGTLFLDEIGELGLDVQPKLLRFLESGEIQPLGDSKPLKVDVRVIASTNASLDTLVAEGRFREDLYYRLKVLGFALPPLRERREEIPPLAEAFLQRAARDYKKGGLRLAEETMEYLVLYRWPGNVRQLANEMRRLAALAEAGAVLMPEHLDPAITAGRRTIPASERELGSDEVVVRLDQPCQAAVEHLERALLQRALRASAGRLEDAARALGLSRKGLYLKRTRLGL